jgi:uncharacterized damage-inducible protein DinB
MVPELVSCFERTVAFLQESVADLSDDDMVLQPPGVPNHAAWTFGHVIHTCEAMAGELGVEPWLPGDWEARFGYGSSPTAVVSHYPGKAALLAALGEASQRLRTALLGMDRAALAEPLPDEQLREMLPTKGHALLQVVAAHTAYHAGQLAAWRRAIGRPAAGVFL